MTNLYELVQRVSLAYVEEGRLKEAQDKWLQKLRRDPKLLESDSRVFWFATNDPGLYVRYLSHGPSDELDSRVIFALSLYVTGEPVAVNNKPRLVVSHQDPK